MLAKSQHWLSSTFLLPLIPLTTLFSWTNSMTGSGLQGRHLTDLNHAWVEDAGGLNYLTVCPPKFISFQQSLKGRFYVLCLLLSIPLYSVARFMHALFLTTYAADIHLYVSFASSVSAATLNCLQSFLAQFSHGCWWINWNWTQINLNSSLPERNGSWANIYLRILLWLLVWKLTKTKFLSESWSNFDKLIRLPLTRVCGLSSSLCVICSQQVGCHGSPSFSISCHSDTVIIWYFCPCCGL